MKAYSFILLFLLCSSKMLFAQQEKLIVHQFAIEGNKKTKSIVILKELNISKGDQIAVKDSSKLLEENRNRILSTGLFNKVHLQFKKDSSQNILHILVQENWYFIPSVVLELADRSFNVWWQEQGRSLQRINYGLQISHYNFTGMKDPLQLKFHLGFTRKVELNYNYPYLNAKKTIGLGAGIFYADNKEMPYITESNRSLYARAPDERILLKRFRAGLVLRNRPNPFLYQAFRLEFHKNAVDPYVLESLNPNYFLNGRNSIQFFYVEYDFQFDKRVYTLYPRSGYILFANVKKEGLGIFKEYENFSAYAGFEKYQNLFSSLIMGTRNIVKANLDRSKVSFANNTGLGWSDDIVSGYDLYVMDGSDYFLSLNQLNYKLIEKDIEYPFWLPAQFKTMNGKIFLRFNFDFAYINERHYLQSNELNNRWIYGFGPALDFIAYNNYLLRLEYSFNDIGEHGLFLNTSISF